MKKLILLVAILNMSFSIYAQQNHFVSAAGNAWASYNLKNANGTWHLSGPRSTSTEPNNNFSIFWKNNSNQYLRRFTLLDNGNLGLGILPHNMLEIGNGFSFHNGGHKILGFGWSFGQNGGGDLNPTKYASSIRLNPDSGTFSFGVSSTVTSAPSTRLLINNLGNIGIGSSNPDSKLTVNGKIHCKEVKVDLAIPADYVFEKYYTGTSALNKDYVMPTLEEVAAYTKANKHLPAVPSAQEIKDNGLHLKEMTNLLLQKVEELTLYTIEQEKRIKALEAKLAATEAAKTTTK